MSKISLNTKPVLRAMNHAYYAANGAHKLLENELKDARKRTLEDEELSTQKRLKKQDEKRITSAKDVLALRGYTKEESQALLSALPHRDVIYRMEDEITT